MSNFSRIFDMSSNIYQLPGATWARIIIGGGGRGSALRTRNTYKWKICAGYMQHWFQIWHTGTASLLFRATKKNKSNSMKRFFQVSACLQWNHHVMCSKYIHCSSPPPSLWFSQFVPPNLNQCPLRRTRFLWLPVAFHDVPARCGLIRWSCHYPRNLWSP